MALSSADKQKLYRQRRDADPERRSRYLQKEKEKYKQDKACGKKKLVKNMTQREHRAAKKRWRNYKQTVKEKQRQIASLVTPPDSPAFSPPRIPEQNVAPLQPFSRQKQRGLMLQRKNRAKLYKKISMLEKQLQLESRKAEMYRKRYQRSKEKKQTTPSCDDTPRTKTKKLLRCFGTRPASRKTVKKALTFHFSLMKQKDASYKAGRTCDKKSIRRIFAGHVLKKYKFKCYGMKTLGLCISERKRPLKGCLTSREGQLVRKFFERDDVSRITSGKKNTKTKGKDKRQRRLMTDTLQNLFSKYKAETNSAISFTTFYRLKPFWVVTPCERDRETCLCKLCENVRYTTESLQNSGLIPVCHIDSLVKQVVCDTNNKSCMYEQCEKCRGKELSFSKDKINDIISYNYWVTVEKEYIQNNQKKKVNTVMKERRSETVGEVLDVFQNLSRYKKHTYNIKNQFLHYRSLKNSLSNNEAFIHIDFSENYVAKMSSEIQQIHYGASKTQITLHTGIYFVGKEVSQTFASVSDSLDHIPSAVWSHLKPVLHEIKEKYPAVDTLHFYSDGPVTQYRQKNNFFLFATEIHDLGFKATWNFHEAGHGKGIPDGIGASVKRLADRHVRHGKNILNASDFINTMKDNSKVHLFIIPMEDITSYQKKISKFQISTVPGTMMIHQMKTDEKGKISYRDVSCKCQTNCSCLDSNPNRMFEFSLKEATVGENGSTNSTTSDFGTHSDSKKKTEIPRREETETSAQIPRSTSNSQYKRYLEELQLCKTYGQLKERVESLEMEEILPCQRYISNDNMSVDSQSNNILSRYRPNDVEREIYPVTVMSDGDCLPSCGSVFAFGHPNNADEIRVRIIHELCQNDILYLSQKHLEKGVEHMNRRSRDLPKSFAFYSDIYVPGSVLTREKVKDIYQMEVLSICKPKTFMGIWQMFALSSVLGLPIFSIYPELGNPFVREHLHRMIYPRNYSDSSCALRIMWTSTRHDMSKTNWIPNHFVPVLEKGVEIHKADKGNDASPAPAMTEKEEDNVKDLDGEKKKGATSKTSDVPSWNTKSDQTSDVQGQPDTKNKREEKHFIFKTDVDELENENIDLQGEVDTQVLLGRYVVVKYNKRPYPGVVLDVSPNELYVSCMHQVGRKVQNCFFWPQKVKDECWYELQNVLAVIKEPIKLETKNNHFMIENVAWQHLLTKL